MPKPTIESHATFLLVEDVDAPYAELLERGADVIHGPATQGYSCYEIRIRDTDGYVLAFGRMA